MTTTIANPDDLLDMVGDDLGTSEWVEISQVDVNEVAEATGDAQRIHVDLEQAAATTTAAAQ